MCMVKRTCIMIVTVVCRSGQNDRWRNSTFSWAKTWNFIQNQKYVYDLSAH